MRKNVGQYIITQFWFRKMFNYRHVQSKHHTASRSKVEYPKYDKYFGIKVFRSY